MSFTDLLWNFTSEQVLLEALFDVLTNRTFCVFEGQVSVDCGFLYLSFK
jgi:hypothetical protein